MASEPPQIQGGTFGAGEADKLHDRLGAHLTEWLRQETSRIDQKVDLKMEGLENKLVGKLDSKPGLGALILNSIAIVAVLLAALSFAGDRFDGGMASTGLLAQQAVERERREAELDAKLEALRRDIAMTRESQRSAVSVPRK